MADFFLSAYYVAMPTIFLFNKPYHTLSQFTDNEGRSTLSNFIKTPKIYPAGRLDYDSEGLLILTGDGQMQARIADPKHKLPKTYWAQVEGEISDEALNKLRKGVTLKDGLTRPAIAERIKEPCLWPRTPPIRQRANAPTSWLALTITEGKNRQVRRMTAEVGFPTLRLIRAAIGPWSIDNLQPGEHKSLEVHLPKQRENKKHSSRNKGRTHSSKKKHPHRKKPS